MASGIVVKADQALIRVIEVVHNVSQPLVLLKGCEEGSMRAQVVTPQEAQVAEVVS